MSAVIVVLKKLLVKHCPLDQNLRVKFTVTVAQGLRGLIEGETGVPKGIRTPFTAVKGRCRPEAQLGVDTGV